MLICQMLEGYMVRERLGSPGLEGRGRGWFCFSYLTETNIFIQPIQSSKTTPYLSCQFNVFESRFRFPLFLNNDLHERGRRLWFPVIFDLQLPTCSKNNKKIGVFIVPALLVCIRPTDIIV